MLMTRLKTASNGPTPPREVYEPLPPGEHFKIRVFLLEPGNSNDILRCTLEVQSLKRTKNTYEAISYVWGDP